MRKQKRTARWASSSLLILCLRCQRACGIRMPLATPAIRASRHGRCRRRRGDDGGHAANVAPDSTVLLPSRIVTGHDGTLGLTQAGTNISVSNDTDVEIPAEAVDGNLIARLVQHRGNVFYDVAPRDVGQAASRDAVARGRHQGHAIQRRRAAGQHDDLVVRRPARDPHARRHRRRAVERRRDRDPLAHRRSDPRRRHGRRPRRRAATGQPAVAAPPLWMSSRRRAWSI